MNTYKCVESLRGTLRPIIYKGENLNKIKPGPFLRYNPYTREIYREYIY